MSRLIELYAKADKSAFTTDILRIYDKFPDETDVIRATGRYLINTDKNQAAIVSNRLSKNNGALANFFIAVSNINTRDDFILDTMTMGDISRKVAELSFSDDSNPQISDFFSAIKSIKSDNKIFWPFVSSISRALHAKKWILQYQVSDYGKTILTKCL